MPLTIPVTSWMNPREMMDHSDHDMAEPAEMVDHSNHDMAEPEQVNDVDHSNH